MKTKIFVCLEEELPESNQPLVLGFNSQEYILVKHQGIIRAFGEKCNHRNRSLKKARISQGVVFCCRMYDFSTGKPLEPISNCSSLSVYQTEIVDGAIYVILDLEEPLSADLITSQLKATL